MEGNDRSAVERGAPNAAPAARIAESTGAPAPAPRLVRVNIMATPALLELLDRASTRAARETGTPALSRSAMIRALCLAFEGLGLHGFRDEEHLRTGVARLLKEGAEARRAANARPRSAAPRPPAVRW